MYKFWFIELSSSLSLPLVVSILLQVPAIISTFPRIPRRDCYLLFASLRERNPWNRPWMKSFRRKRNNSAALRGNLASLAIFSPNYFLANLVTSLSLFFDSLSRSTKTSPIETRGIFLSRVGNETN